MEESDSNSDTFEGREKVREGEKSRRSGGGGYYISESSDIEGETDAISGGGGVGEAEGLESDYYSMTTSSMRLLLLLSVMNAAKKVLQRTFFNAYCFNSCILLLTMPREYLTTRGSNSLIYFPTIGQMHSKYSQIRSANLTFH